MTTADEEPEYAYGHPEALGGPWWAILWEAFRPTWYDRWHPIQRRPNTRDPL